MNIYSMACKICKSRSKIWPNSNYSLKKLPKTVKMLPKWRNHATLEAGNIYCHCEDNTMQSNCRLFVLYDCRTDSAKLFYRTDGVFNSGSLCVQLGIIALTLEQTSIYTRVWGRYKLTTRCVKSPVKISHLSFLLEKIWSIGPRRRWIIRRGIFFQFKLSHTR